MKLNTTEKQFLQRTNDYNMSTRRGAEYELNTSGFTSTTVIDLEKKGFRYSRRCQVHRSQGATICYSRRVGYCRWS